MRFRAWVRALLACLVAARASAATSPTAVTVPLPLPCDLSQSSNARHLSTDASGAVWLIAHCSGQVVVTVSVDGGATWSPARTVWPSAVLQCAIAGGTLPGHAIAAWDSFTGQVFASVTTDFGTTWSSPVTLISLATTTSGMSVVAEGPRYHVMSWSGSRNLAAIRTSPNRGATWNPEVTAAMAWAFGDLVHDPATDRELLVADNPNLVSRTSTDHAATFGPVAPLPGACCLTSSDWAMGGGSRLLGVGSGPDLWRIDLSSATATDVTGMTPAFPAQRAVAADAAATAYAFAHATSGPAIVLQRVPASATAAPAPIALDDTGDYPAIAACETGSAAMAWRTGDGRILFDKRCADGSWTCCEADLNDPPSCAIAAPPVIACAGAATHVTLDASASSDPDGDPLTFAWSSDCPGASFDDATSPAPQLVLDASGACELTCSVTLSVSDGAASTACSATIRVEDEAAPVIAPSDAVVATLWPPNHRLVRIAAGDLAPSVTDACDPAPAWRVTGCLSDQPDDALGDGHASADCVASPDGAAILVRAERDGGRPEGRTYSLFATASDACGNTSLPTLIGLVHVPRDQR